MKIQITVALKLQDVVYWEKMSKCLFQKNNPVFCPTSQTNQGNAPLLKLDFLKIEFKKKKKNPEPYSDVFKDL